MGEHGELENDEDFLGREMKRLFLIRCIIGITLDRHSGMSSMLIYLEEKKSKNMFSQFILFSKKRKLKLSFNLNIIDSVSLTISFFSIF